MRRMRDEDVAAAAELFTTVLEADLARWPAAYGGHLVRPPDARKSLRSLTDLLEFADVDPRGRPVLDAGSGFGFPLLPLGLLGADSLKGVDMSEPMIETVRAYLPLIPDELGRRMDV